MDGRLALRRSRFAGAAPGAQPRSARRHRTRARAAQRLAAAGLAGAAPQHPPRQPRATSPRITISATSSSACSCRPISCTPPRCGRARTIRSSAPRLRKLDAVCRKLELKPADRVVEIGTGWGGFAAARRPALRLPRHDRHHLAGAVCARPRARRRRRSRRSSRGAALRLPQSARPLRQARVHRDDRGGRRALSRHLLREGHRAPEAGTASR